MREYLTSLITVPEKTNTNHEAVWDAELNQRAVEGWVFVQAMRVTDIKYLLIFERGQ